MGKLSDLVFWNISEKSMGRGKGVRTVSVYTSTFRYLAGGKDSCSADSGGPLVTMVDGKWTLGGM